jgi:chemotaxis protein MotB
VEVRGTDEGLLISLTDQKAFAMFAIGSAEPQAQTIHAMEAVAKLLNTRPGKVIIRGFTDARPYKSANYDNWRLSSARAHMAQYMLIHGGLDEKRIAAIEGLADRRPKISTDPMAPENRRIEILIRPDTP